MKNSNAAVLKQGYRMHIECQIKEKIKIMKNVRLLRHLIYRPPIPCCTTCMNFIKIGQLVFEYLTFKDLTLILFIFSSSIVDQVYMCATNTNCQS